MITLRRNSTIAWVAFALLAAPTLAKRVPPKPVAPVISGGIRYTAEGDGRDQYVVATDVSTDKVVWKIKVFHTRIKPFLEEDNQWVFITDLKMVGSSLLVRDEKSRCYSIDLTKQSRKKLRCDSIFAP